MKKYTIEQSGRSMIEMLGVLAIVGVLSVAGIAGYSKAMAKYKLNKLIEQVNNIASAIRTTFDPQGNYNGLTFDTACKMVMFPEYMGKDCTCEHGNSCIMSVYGKQFDIYAGDYGGSSKDSFRITVTVPTKEACTALYSVDWGGATGFLGFVNGSNFTLLPQKNMIEVSTAANSFCSDDGGRVILAFR